MCFIVTLTIAHADFKCPYVSVETKIFQSQNEVIDYKEQVTKDIQIEFGLNGIDIWSDDFDYFMDYEKEKCMDMDLVTFDVKRCLCVENQHEQ